jgi:hypothetical protein
MTTQQLPARATRIDPLVETTRLGASHPAARHKTAAACRGETLLPAADSVSIAIT